MGTKSRSFEMVPEGSRSEGNATGEEGQRCRREAQREDLPCLCCRDPATPPGTSHHLQEGSSRTRADGQWPACASGRLVPPPHQRWCVLPYRPPGGQSLIQLCKSRTHACPRQASIPHLPGGVVWRFPSKTESQDLSLREPPTVQQ